MAVTTSTRLGVTLWSAGGDAFTRAQMQASHEAIEANAAAYDQDVFASRPTAGVAGRVFWSTDTEVLYYDNGVAWKTVGGTAFARVDQANTFTANQTITDVNIILSATTGTKIGTATSQKLSFFNATPIVQPSGSILTALANLGLIATPSLASTALSDTAALAYLSGATFTGDVVVNTGASAGRVQLSTNAGITAAYYWQTAAVSRWVMRKNSDAESGSDAGSTLELLRLNDAGTVGITIWTINRATGATTYTGALYTVASAAGGTGFRLPHGTAPSSPVNGDIWTTSAGMFVRINGVTKTVTLT